MRTPSSSITKNRRQLNSSEMSDTEKEELRLERNYRKSKIKQIFNQFENGEIDCLPEVWNDIYDQIKALLGKIDIIEKTKIAKEYMEFIEKNGRIPRQSTSGKKQIKRSLKSDELAYEESLARRWSNSYMRTIFEGYLEQQNEEIPQEYKEVISRLIELGVGTTRKGYDKEQYSESISKLREYGLKSKRRTSKEIAEASISSLTDIEMSDREDAALKELIEKTKEGGINLDEQS